MDQRFYTINEFLNKGRDKINILEYFLEDTDPNILGSCILLKNPCSNFTILRAGIPH